MRLHHIGYLVTNIKKAIQSFSKLAFKTVKYENGDEIMYDDHRKCFFSFVSNNNVLIELVQPEKTSDIFGLLKRYRNTPYHLCFYCSSLRRDIEILCSDGYTLFLEPAPAPAINNKQIAFLISPSIGIVELVEE